MFKAQLASKRAMVLKQNASVAPFILFKTNGFMTRERIQFPRRYLAGVQFELLMFKTRIGSKDLNNLYCVEESVYYATRTTEI
jgi:hypothetical protein